MGFSVHPKKNNNRTTPPKNPKTHHPKKSQGGTLMKIGFLNKRHPPLVTVYEGAQGHRGMRNGTERYIVNSSGHRDTGMFQESTETPSYTVKRDRGVPRGFGSLFLGDIWIGRTRDADPIHRGRGPNNPKPQKSPFLGVLGGVHPKTQKKPKKVFGLAQPCMFVRCWHTTKGKFSTAVPDS